MGWLKYVDDGLPQWVEIPSKGKLVLGRSRHCDVVLTSPEISRRHVIVQRHKGGVWVADPGTRNGTLLNGERLDAPCALQAGDRLVLGEYEIEYLAEREPAVDLETDMIGGRSGDTELGPTTAVNPAQGVAAAGAATSSRAPALVPTAESLTDTPRWRNVQLIGRGGMGEVYRAHDRDLGVDVAIKKMRRRGDGSERLLERLHAREAAIGRTIRHANVVRTLEDGVHDGDPYMLLDWVEGATLDGYLAEHKATLFDRIELLRQVALGLGAAHAAGVVHADLKPANLLVMDAAPTQSDSNLGILVAPEEELDDDLRGDNSIEDELLGEIAKRAHIDVPDFKHSPFVGREGELQLLQEVVDQTPADGLRWVLVFGERGAGKARLAEEFEAATATQQTEIRQTDGWHAPPAGSTGIWLTLLPPLLPDDEKLHRDYEAGKIAGEVVELYLKPFLHGQAVRLVERMVHDAEAARTFVDFVEAETGGNPARLLAALESSFEAGAWTPQPGGFRFSAAVLTPQEHEAARAMLTEFDADAKGVRDALTTVSALGSCLDFETLIEGAAVDRSSLYYILEHACKAGYLRRDPRGRYWFQSELFRQTLCKRLDPKARLKCVRRVLPRLGELLRDEDPPLPLFSQVAALEKELGYPDRAFVCLVRGSLQARLRYDRERFLDLVDAARECYRDCNREGHRQRELLERATELLGAGGRGLAGLERLRGLPTQVRLKITDFGIARRTTSTEPTATETPWGTPRYMSPEQAARKTLGTESDVFSLGLVAREILEERHPLGMRKGKDAIAVLKTGGPGGPSADSELPAPLQALLTQMLNPEPRKRPAVAEIAQTLQEVQLHLAIQDQR